VRFRQRDRGRCEVPCGRAAAGQEYKRQNRFRICGLGIRLGWKRTDKALRTS
jgi:hypothetical protein